MSRYINPYTDYSWLQEGKSESRIKTIITNNLALFSILSSSHDTKWEIFGIFRGALIIWRKKFTICIVIRQVIL